jgi:DNA-binding GntR family transcriptional regulator
MAVDTGSPSHRQLAQLVTDRVRSSILEGRIRPGEWLRQERLAQEYGVSQMPVREALKRLAVEGFVEHLPYRGARVVTLSPDDVEDLYACRAVLEGRAARYAAIAITVDEVAAIRGYQAGMEACEVPADLQRYRDLNRRFHVAIFSASRRSYLIRSLLQLWSSFPTMLWSNVPRVAVTSIPDRTDPDNAEHGEVVAALEAHDPDRAERAIRAHVESAAAALMAAMGRDA